MRQLYFDKDNNFWIGTRNALYRYANDKLQEFNIEGVYEYANVLTMLEDREGNLWFGTGSGLTQLSDAKVINETFRDGLPARSINAIIEDKDGTRWVGATGGGLLANYSDGTHKLFTKKDGAIDDIVLNMGLDSKNNLCNIFSLSGFR